MLKNDEVDYCTKCTVKPIVKEHMCDEYLQIYAHINGRLELVWERDEDE